jgi:hypothetical protein
MPRYFYHTLDRRWLHDDEGEELAGPAAAKAGALALLGEVVRHAGNGFWETGQFSVLCTDEAGDVVIALTAAVLDAAARDRLAASAAGAAPAP